MGDNLISLGNNDLLIINSAALSTDTIVGSGLDTLNVDGTISYFAGGVIYSSYADAYSVYITASTSGYQSGSTSGYQQTSTSGYQSGSTSGYDTTSTSSYQGTSTSGYQNGSTSGYDTASTSGYQNGSASGYQSGSTSGYDTISTSGYQTNSTSGYQSGSTSSYDNTSTSGYQSGSTSAYDTTSTTTYDGVSTSGYQSGSTSGYENTSTSGYQGGSTSAYDTTSTSGYQTNSTSGYQSGSTSGYQNGSTSGYSSGISTVLGNEEVFSVAYASLLAQDTITGGVNDTLVVLNADTISDSVFAHDSFTGGVALSLSGTSSAYLGSLAAAAGISSIYGGSGNDTITLSSGDTLASQIIGGGGNNLISLDFGGSRPGALEPISQTLNASAFTFANFGSSGSLGMLDGLSLQNVSDSYPGDSRGNYIYNTDSSSDITISGALGDYFTLESGAFSMMGHQDTVTAYAYDGSSLVGEVTLIPDNFYFGSSKRLGFEHVTSVVIKSSSPDEIDIQNLVFDTFGNGPSKPSFNGDMVNGGVGGTNTLQVGVAATLQGGDFANVSNIQVLSLSGSSSAYLGFDAAFAGISTVTSGSGNISLSQGFGYSNSLTVVDSGGDQISVASTSQLPGDNFQTNLGAPDTVYVGGQTLTTGSAYTISGQYNGIAGYLVTGDTLNVTGSFYNSSITGSAGVTASSSGNYLGASTLQSESNSIIVGGNSSLSFSGTASGSFGDSITTGANSTLRFSGQETGQYDVISLGNNNLLEINYASLLATDTIIGGTNDTIYIANADTIDDSLFAHLSFAGGTAISLVGSSSVYLGSLAAAAGITSIYGGTGSNYILQATEDTLGLTVSDLGNDTIQVGTSFNNSGSGKYQLLGDNFLTNGGGNDSIYLDSNIPTPFGIHSLNGSQPALTGQETDLPFSLSNIPIYAVTGDTLNDLGVNQHSTLFASAGVTATYSASGTYSSKYQGNAIIAGDHFNLNYSGTLQGSFGDSITAGASSTLSFTGLGSGIGDIITAGDHSTLSFTNILSGVIDSISAGAYSSLSFTSSASGYYDTITAGDHSTLSFSGNSTSSGKYLPPSGLGNTISLGAYDLVSFSGSGSLAGSYNLIEVGYASLLATDTIIGGLNDTLVISHDDAITDSDFSHVSLGGGTVLSLASGSSATLGANAFVAGITSLFGGTGNIITQPSSDTLGLTISDSGGDVITLGSIEQLPRDNFLVSGSAQDTVIVGGQTLTTGASSSYGNQGDSFSNATLLAVTGDTLNISGSAYGSLIIGSAGVNLSFSGNYGHSSSGYMSYAPQGNKILTGANSALNFTSYLSGWSDVISVGENSTLNFSGGGAASHGAIITAGANSTLSFSGRGAGDDWIRITAGDVSSLSFSGYNSGANGTAITAGESSTLNFLAQYTGRNHDSITAGMNSSLIFSGSGSGQASSIAAGDGSTLSFTGGGDAGTGDFISLGNNDLLSISYASLLATDTITYGANDTIVINGYDTIVNSYGVVISDSSTSSYQFVSTSGYNSASSSAYGLSNAGLASTSAYQGGSTSGYQTNSTSGYVGGSTSAYNNGSTSAYQTNSTSGYQIGSTSGYQSASTSGYQNGSASSYEIGSTSAYNTTSTSEYQSGSTSGYQGTSTSVYDTTSTSGYNASPQHSTTVYDAAHTFYVSASSYFNGSSLTAADTIIGGGNDTLGFNGSATLTDSALAHVSGFTAISLSDSSSVYLGSLAAAAGISSIYGGSGNDTITIGSGDTVASYINAGSGNDLFVLSPVENLTFNRPYTNNTPLLSAGGINFENAYTTSSYNYSPWGSTWTAVLNSSSDGSPMTLSGQNGSTFSLLSGNFYQNDSRDTITAEAFNSSGAQIGSSVTFTGGGSNINFNLDGASYIVLSDSGNYSGNEFNFTNLVIGSSNIDAPLYDTLAGADGSDTLNFGIAVTLSDSVFGNVSGFEVLSLNGSSSAYIGNLAASAGIMSLYGGDNDTLVQNNTSLALASLGNGSDMTFSGNYYSQRGEETISAGDGSTLSFTGYNSGRSNILAGQNASLSFTDSFGGDGFEGQGATISAGNGDTLSFTGSYSGRYSTITLGDNASLSFNQSTSWSQSTITTGNNDTLNFSVAASSNFVINTGTNSDYLSFDNLSLYAASTITGTGNDTIVISGYDTVVTSNGLVISDSSTSGYQSGSTSAYDSGSTTSYDTTSTSGYQFGSTSAYDTASTSAYDTGSTTSYDTASTSGYQSGSTSAYVASNTFHVSASSYLTIASLNGHQTITGGGSDTLKFTQAETINDSLFGTISLGGGSALSLTGGSSVTLGSFAAAAGITSILGASGNNTITQTAGDTLQTTISAGVGADSISTGIANDLISVPYASLLANDTIIGSGADTIYIANADTITAADFAHLSLGAGSVLSLASGANTVALDSLTAAGFSLVTGGTGNTYTEASLGYYSGSLAGSASDTLQIIGADISGDTAFASLSGITALSLGDQGGNSSLTLGSLAAAAGITSIYGGVGNDTITQTTGDTLATYFNTGAVNDLINVPYASMLSTDTFAGSGHDTISVTNPGFYATNDLGNASLSPESILSLASGSSLSWLRSSLYLDPAGPNEFSSILVGNNYVVDDDLTSPTSTHVLGTGIGETLSFDQSGTVADAAFGSFSGFSALSLGYSPSQPFDYDVVNLGLDAMNSGISSIYGANIPANDGNQARSPDLFTDTITQSNLDGNSLFINAGTSYAYIDTGLANDVIYIPYASLLAEDTITGRGQDTIEVGGGGTLSSTNEDLYYSYHDPLHNDSNSFGNIDLSQPAFLSIVGGLNDLNYDYGIGGTYFTTIGGYVHDETILNSSGYVGSTVLLEPFGGNVTIDSSMDGRVSLAPYAPYNISSTNLINTDEGSFVIANGIYNYNQNITLNGQNLYGSTVEYNLNGWPVVDDRDGYQTFSAYTLGGHALVVGNRSEMQDTLSGSSGLGSGDTLRVLYNGGELFTESTATLFGANYRNGVSPVIENAIGNSVVGLTSADNAQGYNFALGSSGVGISVIHLYSSGVHFGQDTFSSVGNGDAIFDGNGYGYTTRVFNGVTDFLGSIGSSPVAHGTLGLPQSITSGMNLTGNVLDGVFLGGANMPYSTLAGAPDAYLVGVNFNHADILDNSSFSGSNLTNASLAGASGNAVNFAGATLTGAYMAGATLQNADFSGSSMYQAAMTYDSITGANFYTDTASGGYAITLGESNMSHATISGSNLYQVSILNANFSADLLSEDTLTNFTNVMMPGATLTNNSMSSLYIGNSSGSSYGNLEGAFITNNNMTGSSWYGLDLSYATLSGDTFGSSNFNNINLTDAYLNDLDLSASTITSLTLSGATLNDCTLPAGFSYPGDAIITSNPVEFNAAPGNFLTAGSGSATLQGWSGTSTLNAATQTLTGGSGADLFVLGDANGNAYGNGHGGVAFINNFTSSDSLSLYNDLSHNYSITSGSYFGGAYNTELYLGSNLVAAINDTESSNGLNSSSSMGHMNLIGSPPA